MLFRKNIGLWISLMMIVIMIFLRFFTSIESSFYVLLFFPSIVILPFGYGERATRFIFVVIYMALSFAIWSNYSVRDLIISLLGGIMVLLGTLVINMVHKKQAE